MGELFNFSKFLNFRIAYRVQLLFHFTSLKSNLQYLNTTKDLEDLL